MASLLSVLVCSLALALAGCDENQNDDPKPDSSGDCPRDVFEMAAEGSDPCQLEMTIEHEYRALRAGPDSQRDFSFTLTGSLEQLYPHTFLSENPDLAAHPWINFSGSARSQGTSFVTDPILPQEFKPFPRGPHTPTRDAQADFSGPVDHLVIERFWQRLDDPSKLCVSIHAGVLMTGEGVARYTLADGSTRDKSIPPMGSELIPRGDDGDEWVLHKWPPKSTMVCEGPPPTGTGPDCAGDPLGHFGNEVCAPENVVGCSSGDCQVDYNLIAEQNVPDGYPRIWYGMRANDQRTHWTFDGTLQKIRGVDEQTWRLKLEIHKVPQTLEYE